MISGSIQEPYFYSVEEGVLKKNNSLYKLALLAEDESPYNNGWLILIN